MFKVKGFSKSQHFVRVGTVNMPNMSKPGTKGLGPRIHNVRSLQTNLINSIASKSTLLDASPQDQSTSNIAAATDVEEVYGVPDPTTVGLTLLRMKTTLLPLILKQELLDLDAFWLPIGDSDKIASVIIDIARELQQQKDDKLSEILGTSRAPVLPQTPDNLNKYPTLKQYGVSLEDRRVHQRLLSELYHLNNKHDNNTTLHSNVPANYLPSFVFLSFS